MANKRFIDFPIATTVGDNDIILIWQGGANKQTTKATILSGVPDSLNDLTDVTISGLTNGQILRYDSVTGQWENTDQGNLDLNDLNDVTIVSPTNGQVLVYNSSTSKWENSSGGYVPYVGAVTTVNLGAQTIQAGSFVKQSGTASQFLKADGSVDSTAYGTGSVTSVGLTMPAAFNVANSPITTSGTLAVTGAGTVAQYIRGDGSLADFPESSGGGSSVSYYLNGSVDQGTIGGIAYKELSKVPILGAGTDFTINADGYIASFITDAGDPNLLEIPGGNWNFETYFSASSSGGTPTFYVELYKVSGTTATLIASSSSAPELIAFGTNLNPYFSTLAVPTTTLALTDRLAVRYYVTHSGRTITLHTENNHLCQIVTTFTTGITALNGLTAQVQNFAVGTTGTDFNIASATATHTFNLPTASATNRGALSSADWGTFNSKQNALTLTTTGTSGAASLVGATLNIPNYGSALSGYLPLTGGTLTGPLGGTSISLSGDITANRYRGVNSLVLNSYTTVNPSSNVYLYSPPNDRDAWIYLDSADTASNWGIYHRQIDTAVSGLPANSIGFIGGNSSTLQAWISLANGNGFFAGSLTASSIIRSGGTSSQYLMADGSVSTLTNPITGTGSAGQVAYFIGTTAISSESNLFWDATNNRLGINNSTPEASLDLGNTGGQKFYAYNGGSGNRNGLGLDLGGNSYELSVFFAYGASDNGRITFGSLNGTTYSTKMTIFGNGNVNIIGNLTANSFIKSGGTSSQYLMADGSVSTLSNPVTGTGTTNYLPKFTGSTTIGNSQIIDNGTQVGIGLNPNTSYGTLQIKAPSGVYSLDLVGRTAGLNGESQISFWNAAQSSVLAYITNTGSNLYLGTGANQPFTLSSGGNFIFGSTSDNGARLQVSGDIRTTGTLRVEGNTDPNSGAAAFFWNQPFLGPTISGYNFEVRTGNTGSQARRLFINESGAATFSSSVTVGTDLTLNSGTLFVSAGSGQAYSGRLSTAYIFPWITTYLDSFAGPSWEGRLQFRTNSGGGAMNTHMTILNNGNVGIGTPSPNANSRLHVYRGGGSYDTIIADGDAGTNTGFAIYEGGSARYALYSNGAGGNDSFNIYNFGAATNSLTIFTNGNVGISSATDNGQAIVQIGGSNNTKLSLKDGSSQNGMRWESVAGANTFYLFNGNFGTTGWGLYNVTTAATPIWVTNTSRVGIGTTSPSAKLSLGSDTGRKLFVYDDGGGANDIGGGMGTDLGGFSAETSIFFGNYGGSGRLSIGAWTSSQTYSTKLTIFGNGNVAIGRTNDDGAKLSVNGLIRANDSLLGGISSSSLSTGTVYSLGGTLTNTNPSDLRLKENIEPINYGLSQILQLNAVTFNWKSDNINQGKQYGFIAQEVQEIMPDLVKKGEYLGLDKEGIFTTLVKAIQELKQEIDTLKN